MRLNFFIVLLSFTFVVSAQVFTWQDENGITHFGDRIPEKYKQVSTKLEVKTNVVEMMRYERDSNETVPADVKEKVKKTERLSGAEVCKEKWENIIGRCSVLHPADLTRLDFLVQA